MVERITDDMVERAYEAAKAAMPHEALREIAPGELERVVRAVLAAALSAPAPAPGVEEALGWLDGPKLASEIWLASNCSDQTGSREGSHLMVMPENGAFEIDAKKLLRRLKAIAPDAAAQDDAWVALRKLANEAGGLKAFEGEIRAAIGNANWSVLQQRIDEAGAALVRIPSPQAAPGAEEIERNTHLLEWLGDGFTNCQHGSREWCEGYLHNALDVITAQDAALAALSAKLAEVERELETFIVAHALEHKKRLTAEASAADLRRKLEERNEALGVFASQASRFDDIPGVVTTHDNVELWQNPNYRCPITVGDLRRARALTSGAEQ